MLNTLFTFIEYRSCAFCGGKIGTRQAEPLAAGGSSPGICAACLVSIVGKRVPKRGTRFFLEEE
jgi:hypothetical protein